MRAQDIRFSPLGSLQNDQVIWVAQWRAISRVQDYAMRHALQKLRVVEKIRFREAVKRLKLGVPEHLGYFGKYFI